MALLGALVAGLGPALTSLPIGVLRVAVGGLLLVFGLQWLRKAILRAGGPEGAPRRGGDLRARDRRRPATRAGRIGFDPYSFTVAFKGVLLEGLEVAFIVLTFGANQHRIGLAAIAAAAAIVCVAALGVAVHAPLARVPENAMKFAVGVMLTSFGTFWGAEGAGASWPGGDAALLVIIPALLALSLGFVAVIRRAIAPAAGVAATVGEQ